MNDKRICCQKNKGKNCRNFPNSTLEKNESTTYILKKKITTWNKNEYNKNSGGNK